MIHDRCLLRKISLPLIPCDEPRCDWYIRDADCNNCFWVLSEVFIKFPQELSIEDIAKLEGITVNEAQELLEGAIIKFRTNIRQFLKEM